MIRSKLLELDKDSNAQDSYVYCFAKNIDSENGLVVKAENKTEGSYGLGSEEVLNMCRSFINLVDPSKPVYKSCSV